jgi:hypothetical protein
MIDDELDGVFDGLPEGRAVGMGIEMKLQVQGKRYRRKSPNTSTADLWRIPFMSSFMDFRRLRSLNLSREVGVGRDAIRRERTVQL